MGVVVIIIVNNGGGGGIRVRVGVGVVRVWRRDAEEGPEAESETTQLLQREAEDKI